MNRQDRQSALREALKQRILVLDGAMGTALQARDLSPEDFGGPDFEGCNENLNRLRPNIIEEIHREHLQAGADIIETNSFGGTPIVLAEYGLESFSEEINERSAQLARTVSESFWTSQKPRFVAGSMGPTTKAISVTGGISFQELAENFFVQAKALHRGGVDYFLLETCQDTRNVKAALLGIQKLFDQGVDPIPIAISGTIEKTGTMLAGQTIEAFWASLAHLDLLYIGLNCATGPKFMTDHLRALSELSTFPVSCVPNAGLPNEDGCYLETPESVATLMKRFIESGWVNLVGGCCGMRAEHIRALSQTVGGKKPRTLVKKSFSFLSGIDFLEINEEKRPILVGERTNVIGSRKFKKLIEKNEFETATEIARKQIKNGAQIIDICLANPDRDELEDMESFLSFAGKTTRVPWMIDSTDEQVIRLAFEYSQGKILINSINLEDGENRFASIAPLIKQFGAGVVVGTIDDDPQEGMAISRTRKLEIAQRSYELLTEKYGLSPEDLYFDPLVFPCASGDQNFVGSAVETIEGLRQIKAAFPECKSVLGISNVSFGLPTSGREILNSVFLQHCTLAGLDLAIVNTQLLKRYPTIPKHEKELAENLLFNRGEDPISEFADYFREKKVSTHPIEKLPLPQRIPNYVIEGTKDGLIGDLNELLKEGKDPLQIINGPLMTGMDEVGRLFGRNELIVAEVLQSAEVMKTAVDHLKPHMKTNQVSSRGRMILATVKGDVHDIGKNLVEIIFSNNGFEIENLGIKVPPADIIAAAQRTQPDLIGLSGLLVKSAHQMVHTAEDLAAVSIETPLLLGGAALSHTFTRKRIAPKYKGPVLYAKDAMSGLELAKQMMDEEGRKNLLSKLQQEDVDSEISETTKENSSAPRRSDLQPISSPPEPWDYERHTVLGLTLHDVWPFLNPRMLLGRHLGLQNTSIRLLEEEAFEKLKETSKGKKALEIWNMVKGLKEEAVSQNWIQPKAVYQFFKANAEHERIHIHAKTSTSFEFPRKATKPYLCISDYLNPSPKEDNLALFVTTAGSKAYQQAEIFKKEGQYLKSHVLMAMALETAEAMAEYIHKQIRAAWNQSDPPNLSKMDLFRAHYAGKRFSFGYPACPDLEGQVPLFELLRPEEIGVQLTDGFMMDPECSVSALVFHHPDAKYFSV